MMFELTEKECEGVVRKATDGDRVEIEKFSLVSFGNYLGFLGEYFRLRVDAVVDGNRSEWKFFVKSLPMKDLKQRKMLVESGIFRKETKLYGGLLAELTRIIDGWCPKALLTRDDLLVLEDLSLKGYKLLDNPEDFTQKHVEATLSSLARFHCASIVLEDDQRVGRKSIADEFGDVLFETSVDDIPWFRSGLKVPHFIASRLRKHLKYFHLSPDNRRHCLGANEVRRVAPRFVTS